MSTTTTILGIGLDLIDLDRFRILYGNEDPEVLSRCFTNHEQVSVGKGPDRLARLAARFAAKEATYKALGGGIGVALTDILVEGSDTGAPQITLKGQARVVADQKGVGTLLVSLTHSDASAAAVVIALSGGPM